MLFSTNRRQRNRKLHYQHAAKNQAVRARKLRSEQLEDRLVLSSGTGLEYPFAAIANAEYDAASYQSDNSPGKPAANDFNAADKQQGKFKAGEILVGFDGSVVAEFHQRGLGRAMQVAAGLVAPFGLTGGAALFATPTVAGHAAKLVTHWNLPASADVLDVANSLKGRPGIAYAEPNGIMSVQTHGDPSSPQDPGFTNPAPGWPFGVQEHLPQVNAEEAWHTPQGSGVIVAVVDTGVDLDHPDLNGNLVPGTTIMKGSTKLGKDDNGHGTHVAGIIAAEINNMMDLAVQAAGNNAWKGGTVGVAPQAKIMPVKVLNSGGSGAVADIAKGITYAADKGAQIINMSLGGGFAQSVKDAILYAYNRGVLVISAAGNGNTENPSYPAADPLSLSVAAVDSSDVRAPFSNYGNTVDVAAPGVNILSTFIDVDDGGESGGLTGAYGRISGTSMATPAAAGVAALIKSLHPTWTPIEVASQLLATADNIDALNPGFAGKLGAGRIDAAAAVGTPVSAPVVIATSGIGGTLNRLEVGQAINVQFSHVMTAGSVLDIANYELLYLGTNGVVGGGDDQPIPLSMVSTSYDAFPGRGVQLAISNAAPNAPDGNYQLRVKGSGLNLDGNRDGLAGDDFVRSFTLEPRAIAGFRSVEPLGSLVYQATAADTFNSAGDIDRFSIELDGSPEQVVSVRVNSSVSSTTTMWHNGVPVDLDGDGNAGPLSAGTMVIQVTGPMAGSYSLDVLLNAVRSSTAAVQNLDGTFVTLASTGDFDQLNFSADRAAVLGSFGSYTASTILDDFDDNNKTEYTEQANGKNRTSNTTVTGAAAHDGAYGLADANNDGLGGWIYRTDAQVQVQRGDTISVWVRSEPPTSGMTSGRGYFGFGANSSGTLSMQMAPNTGQLILGRHSGYTNYENLALVSQSWQANKWYRFVIDWKINGDIIGQLYDSDGVTLLNTVTGNDQTISSGGIAFRSFYSTRHFDTVEKLTKDDTPHVYSFSLMAGQTATLVAARLAGTTPLIEVSGDGATWTVANSIAGSAADADGIYYVRVTGDIGTEYTLQVLRSAVIEEEANDTAADAQPLTQQVALGAINRVFYAGAAPVIESFDSGGAALDGYTLVGGTVDARITSAAAHAGGLGLENRTSSGWLYRDDAAVHLDRGDSVSVWVRSDGNPTGRAYFGFGASAAGTLSLVMAPNSGQFMLQQNVDYGFADLAVTPFAWQADHWYRMEASWGAAGDITGRLYDSDGSTLLATLSGNDDQFTSGGIAFRAFGSTKHFDSVQTGALNPYFYGLHSDFYSVALNAGDSRTFSTLTPASGPGQFSNQLNPGLQIVGPGGSLIDTSATGLGDQSITFTADVDGDYIIRVFAEDLNTGEYILIDPPAGVSEAGTLAAALALEEATSSSNGDELFASLAGVGRAPLDHVHSDVRLLGSREFGPVARPAWSVYDQSARLAALEAWSDGNPSPRHTMTPFDGLLRSFDEEVENVQTGFIDSIFAELANKLTSDGMFWKCAPA
jgi:subtilisin family serine protease